MDNEFDSEFNYREAIADIAEYVIDPDNWDDNIDEYERIFERVDSSRWAFITYGATMTLIHSQNTDAYFEQGIGTLESCNSYCDVVTTLAFYAIHEDVCEKIQELKENQE